MSTLEDRLRAGLHDLADDPSGGSADRRTAHDLWSAGRRHRRSRRAGTVVVLVAAVALLGLTLGGARVRATPDPAPAGTGATPTLPDHFYVPSPWLPGTDGDPSGRLVATIPTARGTWGGVRPGVVGVSAAGAEYRFLDLPDLAQDDQAVLSPDGRSVAFWTLGTPTDAPREEAGEETGGTITGYAVYDTETGEVRREPVPTRYGLGVGSFAAPTLVWADATHVVATYGQVQGGPDDPDGRARTTGTATWVWAPASSADPRRLDLVGDDEVAGSTGAGEVVVETSPGPGRATRYDLVALDGTRRDGPVPGVITRAPVFDGPGDRFAFFRGEREFGPLRVAEVDSRRTLLPSPVLGVVAVAGWPDRETVVVMRAGGRVPNRLDFVDVTNARVTRGPLVDQQIRDSLDLATDLLSSPVVAATAPPRPLDPRVVVGQSATILALAVGSLWLWRRRRVHLP